MIPQTIVNDYNSKRHGEISLATQLTYYRSLPDLASAIIDACDKGKYVTQNKTYRNRHFDRRKKKQLQKVSTKLLANETLLKKSAGFDEIYAHVKELSHKIKDIGPLTIYDIALRLGAQLRKLPVNNVYLHAGAAVGASYLGVKLSKGFSYVHKNTLTNDLSLTGYDIENILCIYKQFLGTKNPNIIHLPKKIKSRNGGKVTTYSRSMC